MCQCNINNVNNTNSLKLYYGVKFLRANSPMREILLVYFVQLARSQKAFLDFRQPQSRGDGDIGMVHGNNNFEREASANLA